MARTVFELRFDDVQNQQTQAKEGPTEPQNELCRFVGSSKIRISVFWVQRRGLRGVEEEELLFAPAGPFRGAVRLWKFYITESWKLRWLHWRGHFQWL